MWPPSITTTPRLRLAALRDGIGNREEVTRDQDIGKRAEERREGAVRAGRRRKLFRADLVGALRDGNRAHARKVGLGGPRLARSRSTVTFSRRGRGGHVVRESHLSE